MVLMTIIARLQDGLPLAASVQENEEIGRSLTDYQTQAKQLFRKMTPNSPKRGSLETGPYYFHYLIDKGICYLILTEQTFSKRVAFMFLEDIENEFRTQYGSRIESVSRPYGFIEFDTYIQKTKKSYSDSRTRRNLTNINSELQDVQKLMVQNIDDVLQRGEALSALDDKASNLATMSQKYRKDAKHLNLRTSYAKIAAIVIIFILFLLFIRYWLF